MYNIFSKYYDHLMNLDYDGYFEVLSGMVELKNKDLLEIGCGTGQMTKRLLKPSRSIIACDVSEEMLSLATSSLKDQRLSFHLLEDTLPFSNSFDVVVAPIDVYHYLDEESLKRHLKDVRSHLREGGTLVFDLREDLLSLQEDVSYDVGEDFDFFWFNEWDEKEEALHMDFYFYTKEGEYFKREVETQTLYHHPLERINQTLTELGFVSIQSELFEGRVLIKATT